MPVRLEVLEALSCVHTEAARLAAEDKSQRRYTHVSVRSLADQLGFHNLLPEMLAECVEEGFSYCLDSTVKCNEGFPSQDVCMWGADQLTSRLAFVLPYGHRRRSN